MKSKEMRENPLFMRNTFPTVGKWGIPIVKKQELPTNDIQLLSSANARSNDSAKKEIIGPGNQYYEKYKKLFKGVKL